MRFTDVNWSILMNGMDNVPKKRKKKYNQEKERRMRIFRDRTEYFDEEIYDHRKPDK